MARPTRLLALLATLATLGLPAVASADEHVTRTLHFQDRLADDLPVTVAPFYGTHNSYNSLTEPFSPSTRDNNQVITLTEQLDLGARYLELDLHLYANANTGGVRAPVLCHARGAREGHAGCTTERTFEQRLPEIRDWLRAHPRTVLLLDLEDHLENADGHAQAAETLTRILGPLLHRPANGGRCGKPPASLTREQVLAQGAQVIALSKCDGGPVWSSLVYDRESYVEQRVDDEFTDAPECGPEFDRRTVRDEWTRIFEDDTRVGAATGAGAGISPRVAREAAQCGVDIISVDTLVADDARFEALAWSWRRGEPSSGACVLQGVRGLWASRGCTRGRARVACRLRDGSWAVTRSGVRPYTRPANRACRRLGGRFAAPRTAQENLLLRQARERAGASRVWIGLRRGGPDGFRALDPRS